jgi:hypothetical protein
LAEASFEELRLQLQGFLVTVVNEKGVRETRLDAFRQAVEKMREIKMRGFCTEKDKVLCLLNASLELDAGITPQEIFCLLSGSPLAGPVSSGHHMC